jgi:hypothetical protein
MPHCERDEGHHPDKAQRAQDANRIGHFEPGGASFQFLM